jgi:hypothetical protein
VVVVDFSPCLKVYLSGVALKEPTVGGSGGPPQALIAALNANAPNTADNCFLYIIISMR